MAAYDIHLGRGQGSFAAIICVLRIFQNYFLFASQDIEMQSSGKHCSVIVNLSFYT